MKAKVITPEIKLQDVTSIAGQYIAQQLHKAARQAARTALQGIRLAADAWAAVNNQTARHFDAPLSEVLAIGSLFLAFYFFIVMFA